MVVLKYVLCCHFILCGGSDKYFFIIPQYTFLGLWWVENILRGGTRICSLVIPEHFSVNIGIYCVAVSEHALWWFDYALLWGRYTLCGGFGICFVGMSDYALWKCWHMICCGVGTCFVVVSDYAL